MIERIETENESVTAPTSEKTEENAVVEYTLRTTSMKRFAARLNKTLAKIQALVDKEMAALVDSDLEAYQQELLATAQGNITEDIDICREAIDGMAILPICVITNHGVYFAGLPLTKIKEMMEQEPDKYYIQGSNGGTINIKTLERLVSEKENNTTS